VELLFRCGGNETIGDDKVAGAHAYFLQHTVVSGFLAQAGATVTTLRIRAKGSSVSKMTRGGVCMLTVLAGLTL
jgi:hypothetical protein